MMICIHCSDRSSNRCNHCSTKLFIRRGQTNVHIIGDLVRATLFIDDEESLKQIIDKVERTFPKIVGRRFQPPDSFDGIVGFLSYIHSTLTFLPGSNDVLPYRFKANSSQKHKEVKLWYNFNFFRQIPGYHRVGQSEMFVACELQIGLTDEIEKHRHSHVAYERDRILANQRLLKNYDEFVASTQDEEGDDTLSTNAGSRVLSVTDSARGSGSGFNTRADDIALIRKVLFGRVATEVLIPCTDIAKDVGSDDDNEDDRNWEGKILAFEKGPFSLREELQRKDGDDATATDDGTVSRLWINNRSINWHSSTKHQQRSRVIAGPYNLKKEKRYYVDAFTIIDLDEFHGTIGLYAHVGPCYTIQLACCDVRGTTKKKDNKNNEKSKMTTYEHVIVEPGGRNLTFLEQVCPVPSDTTAIDVIAHGYLLENFCYQKIHLSVREFDTPSV